MLAITAIGGYLRLVQLGDVRGNPFYDAAVHTMAVSWHAFLFGGLDPSGGVSVDKPPVDLWFQVASVKLFGFNATALKLPQALAGTACIPLVYDLVRRPFGRFAGLGAAAAMAVMPVAILTARSDTMDTLLAFLLLLAAWLVARAVERRSIGWLLAAGAVVGLAFNVKLFQALLPLPALALLWLVGSRLRPTRRLLAAFAALAVAVVVAFAWIVPVALTPRSQRPYPIGSTNGSIWNLVFVFNGVDRLHGRPIDTPDTLPPGSKVSAAIVRSQQSRARRLSTTSGPLVLIGNHFSQRIGSELAPALFTILAGALLLAIALARRRDIGWRTDPGRLALGVGVGVSSWVLIGYALFSSMGRFHPRYFETISPAVAAALGGGLLLLVTRAGRSGRVLAAGVMAATAAYLEWQTRVLGSNGHVGAVACAIAALAVLATAVRTPSARVLGTVGALALAACLFIPLQASRDLVHARASDAERSGAMPPSWPRHFNRYLEAHRNGSRYLVGSIAPAKAAPLIQADPQPVLMLTSYRSRPLLSVPQLAAIVRRGEVRYFLIGRRCVSKLTRDTAACPANARWVMSHSTDVTPAVGIGHRHGLLYRINYCSAAGTPAARAPARGRGRSARRSGQPGSAQSASRASQAKCVLRQ